MIHSTAEISVSNATLAADDSEAVVVEGLNSVTNTASVITIEDVDLTLADGTNLLVVAGNDGSRGWGTEGANGGDAEFDLSRQTASGDIVVDEISQLAMSIADGSAYTGAINTDGTTAAGLSVTIDDSSTWTLTGDSYVDELDGDMDNVELNGFTLYLDGTAVAGS